MADIEQDGGFLQRWSRRKSGAREGQVLPATPVVPMSRPPTADAAAEAERGTPPPARSTTPPPAQEAAPADPPPPPTLEEAAQLTPASDFSRFVASGVNNDVRNVALKKLFADPHFNLMDGLDTYIEDFGKPDPLPAGMLRRMAQAELLNLFADEKKVEGQATATAAVHSPETPADEDADLRLQPNDAAGPPGADPGTGPHAGDKH